MSQWEDDQRAAELLADIDADLAERFRARAKQGRPRDPGHLDMLLDERDKMRARIAEGHKRDAVCKAWAARRGGEDSYWRNVLTFRGRDDLKQRHEERLAENLLSASEPT